MNAIYSEKNILKKKIAQGVVYMSGKRVMLQFIATCSNILLARLLMPAEFGIFALVTFTSVFFTVFSDIGFGAALIQKQQEVEKEDIHMVFTIQLLLNIMIVSVLYFASPYLVQFYHLNENIVWLFRLYALTFLLLPFKSISSALLERQLHYKRLAAIEIAEISVSSAITIFSAINGAGVFSFVYGALAGQSIGVVLYLTYSRWQVGFGIEKKRLRALAKFGIPFQGHVILGLFYGPLILLYLGKVAGSEQLGYYQFAAGVAVFPLGVSEIISRMMFALVARTSSDKEITQKIVAGGLTVISALTFPLVSTIFIAAPLLISVVYTSRWLPAVPALRISLLQTAVYAFTGFFIQVLLALGKSKIIRKMGMAWAVLTWMIAPFCILRYGFVGMSIATFLISVSGMYLYVLLNAQIRMSLSKTVFPYLAAAIISALGAYVTQMAMIDSVFQLIVTSAVGLVLYGSIIWVLFRHRLASLLPLFVKYARSAL